MPFLYYKLNMYLRCFKKNGKSQIYFRLLKMILLDVTSYIWYLAAIIMAGKSL